MGKVFVYSIDPTNGFFLATPYLEPAICLWEPKISNCSNLNFDCKFEIYMKNWKWQVVSFLGSGPEGDEVL